VFKNSSEPQISDFIPTLPPKYVFRLEITVDNGEPVQSLQIFLKEYRNARKDLFQNGHSFTIAHLPSFYKLL